MAEGKQIRLFLIGLAMCLKAAAVNLVESINAKKLSVQAFISCLVTKVMEVHWLILVKATILQVA